MKRAGTRNIFFFFTWPYISLYIHEATSLVTRITIVTKRGSNLRSAFDIKYILGHPLLFLCLASSDRPRFSRFQKKKMLR